MPPSLSLLGYLPRPHPSPAPSLAPPSPPPSQLTAAKPLALLFTFHSFSPHLYPSSNHRDLCCFLSSTPSAPSSLSTHFPLLGSSSEGSIHGRSCAVVPMKKDDPISKLTNSLSPSCANLIVSSFVPRKKDDILLCSQEKASTSPASIHPSSTIDSTSSNQHTTLVNGRQATVFSHD